MERGADQSMAGLCKAEVANRMTTSNTECITVHVLQTGIDGIHYPAELKGFQQYRLESCFIYFLVPSVVRC